ncbi:MAG: hypothetical protein AABW59_01720 [archaeon]
MPLPQAFWKKRTADFGKRLPQKRKIVRRIVSAGIVAGILAGVFGHNYARAHDKLTMERSIPQSEIRTIHENGKVRILGKGLEPIKPKLSKAEVAKEAAKVMFARK